MLDITENNFWEQDIQPWCNWARKEIPAFFQQNRQRANADGSLPAHTVDLSNNGLSDVGLHAILQVFHALNLTVKVFKLYNNKIGRGGAYALADWIEKCLVALLELHLSDNYIPVEGGAVIFEAIANNLAYPPEKRGFGNVPLWLRLERNLIDEPDEFTRVAEELMKNTRPTAKVICLVRRREVFGCKTNRCCFASKDGSCPVVHLCYCGNQKPMHTALPREARAWNDAAGEGELERWSV